MKGLNDKQRKFCDYLTEGLDKADAYRRAYKSKSSPAVCASCASKLLKNANIEAYLSKLRAEIKQGVILTRREILEYLTLVVKTPVGKIDDKSELCEEVSISQNGAKTKMPSKLAAIVEINKMLGHYEPEKTETTVNVVGIVLDGLKPKHLIKGE
ncbi:MAG: terminase small subunit [Akkermansia sp.]